MIITKNIIPKATGTLADIKANTQIGKVHGGYFSSDKNIKEFIKVGISPIVPDLQKEIIYLDFGGGEGVLTINVQ